MTKILFVTEFFPTGKDLRFSGGVEARTFFVAKYLAKKNQVSVIASRQPGTKKLELISGIKIYRVGPTLKYYATGKAQDFLAVLRFIFSAIKTGSIINPDLVEGNNFLTHFIAKQISQKTKAPVVFWYPDVFLGQWVKTSGLLVGMSGWLLERINLTRSANHFIAISRVTEEKLLKTGIAKNKISTIACGVDLEEFSLKVQKQKLATIVCIARLVTYKRVEDLIWAYALLHKNNPNLRLTIIGRGPEQENLEHICRMLKITKNVKFASNLTRSELVNAIKSSHLLCLPSQTEGFGISIIESAAAGVPYVVSDIEVFKEITKNGQGGLFFKLGDVRDLSAKIKKLLNDKNLYTKKSKEARILAQNYQWSQIAKETEQVYESCLNN